MDSKQVEDMQEAIQCAKSILDYVAGDQWERECTEKDRNRFYELYDKLFPPESKKEPKPSFYCEKCKRSFLYDYSLKSHLDTSRAHHSDRSPKKHIPTKAEEEQSEDSEGMQFIQRQLDYY
jgi:hypothetical protein